MVKLLGVLCRTVIATLVLCLLPGLPEARAEYSNASFMAVLGAPPVGAGTFTLPDGARFPQVTIGDYVPADGDNHVVSVSTGLTLDFYLSVGEIGGDVVSGKMRLTALRLETPEDTKILNLGTYTLFLQDDGGPYQVSGPVVGDRYTLYFPGKDTKGTAADTTDDAWFLFKVHQNAVGPDSDNPAFLSGRAQIVMGDRILAQADESATATTVPGTNMAAALDAPGLPTGSIFNQILPEDGSGDLPLGADTPAAFSTGRVRNGAFAGSGDPLTTVTYSLALTDGGTKVTKGIFLNRFTRTVAGGKTVEGFMVGNLGETDDAGNTPAEGYLFAFVTPQATPTILLGSVEGAGSNTASSAQYSTVLAGVDFVPPEVFPVGDTPDLFADRFTQYPSSAWDFNGWRDVASVQFLINDSTASNRILARYDAVRNRLSLYNKALRKWVGTCAPGAAGSIRTPYATLDCKTTAVARSGEMVTVIWSLKPTAKMFAPLKANTYLKVTDRAGLVAGWRMISSEQFIGAVGP